MGLTLKSTKPIGGLAIMLPKICSIPECERTVSSRGWCQPHYKRWLKYGDTGKSAYSDKPTQCVAEDCDQHAKYRTAGLCGKHYQRLRNTGTTSAPTVKERFWSSVPSTPVEGCWEWKGSMRDDRYGQMRIDGTLVRAHRFSYELHNGAIPGGMVIDHICHNPSCVNPQHLRSVTNKQNMENRSGLDSNNTTGARGVSWDKRTNKWIARARHNGRTIVGGYFSELEDAAEAAVNLRNELFTHNDLDRIAS